MAGQPFIARITGASFLLSTTMVMVANIYLLSGLVISGDASATAANLLAHSTRFRVAIVFNLIYVLFVLIHTAGLFALLRPVNLFLAASATLLRMSFVTMWMLSALNMLLALSYLGKAPYLKAFEQAQLEAIASMFMLGNFHAYYAGLPLYAAAMIFTSLLWYRSGLMWKWFAGFGVGASVWCLFCAICYLLYPQFGSVVNIWAFDTPMVLMFEAVVAIWLMTRHSAPQAASSEPQKRGQKRGQVHLSSES
jgi:hypothetical protein